MQTWPTRVGAVLAMLDPAVGPRATLGHLWNEVVGWQTIGGIWIHCPPGHLQPSGTFVAGDVPGNLDEILALATPQTAPINTDGLPVVAKQLRDGNVPVATVLVSHAPRPGAEEAAAFLVDVLSRYLMDRLRVQLEISELTEENAALRNELAPRITTGQIPTVSGAMQHLISTAVRAAASTASVLIQGEVGTGKELLGGLIHSHSARAAAPMLMLNAGTLPAGVAEAELFGVAPGTYPGEAESRKGLFELASGGTVFIDQVGELGPEAQVRLLRALSERCFSRVGEIATRPCDVRVIAATTVDLADEVAAGRFRADLYYRLNIVSLVVPPLRSRQEDIPHLINHFIARFNGEHYKGVESVPPRVLDLLMAYPWPGNVRELENVINKAVLLAPGRELLEDLLPPVIRAGRDAGTALPLRPAERARPGTTATNGDAHVALSALSSALERYAAQAGADLGRFVETAERVLIAWTLNQERGVKLRAARQLGINRVTLDRKLSQYNIRTRRGQGVTDNDDSESPAAVPPGAA